MSVGLETGEEERLSVKVEMEGPREVEGGVVEEVTKMTVKRMRAIAGDV